MNKLYFNKSTKTFSKKSEKDKSKKQPKKDKPLYPVVSNKQIQTAVALPIIGVGLGDLANKATDRIGEKASDHIVKSFPHRSSKDPELINKLIDHHKKVTGKDIKVHNISDFHNAAAIYPNKILKYGYKVDPKSMDTVVTSKYGPGMAQVIKQVSTDPSKRDHMVIGGSTTGQFNTAPVVAHELGHLKRGLAKPLLGIGSPYQIPKARPAMIITTGVTGTVAGYNHERNKFKGRKSNLITKVGGVAMPLALGVHQMTPEIAASVKGYKSMKAIGASPEELKTTKKTLTKAAGTYLITPAVHLGTGLASRYIGKSIAKKQNLRELKAENPHLTDKELKLEYKRRLKQSKKK